MCIVLQLPEVPTQNLLDRYKNKMEGNRPAWLTDTFLEMAIKSAENDPTVNTISFEVMNMVSPGDHFMSNIYGATVHYTKASESKEEALVIKAVPEKEIHSKLAEEGNFFELEITMLRDVSRAMEHILQKLPFGHYQHFSPRYLYSQKNPVAIIVMENLKKTGFRMLDRATGLDYEHSLLVMKTLARFHAASVVLNRDNPQMLEKFKKSDPCLALRIALQSASKLSLRNLEKEIATWPEYKEKYCHKIVNMTENAVNDWYDGRKRNDEEFNVLTHSDLWINNMMFRYSQETGNLENIRFLDYQFSYWTSPAVDILYFLNSSTAISITDKHQILVEEYHKELSNILTYFAISHPTLQDLFNEMHKRAAIGVQVTFGFRAVIMADKNQVTEFITEEKQDRTFQLSESYKEAMRVLLPVLEQRGWLK